MATKNGKVVISEVRNDPISLPREIIQVGSIVEVIDKDLALKRQQGLVVKVHRHAKSEKRCVAVFFGPEIPAQIFDSPICTVDNWDANHFWDCKRGNFEFLFEERNQKRCPRILRFQPEQLVVVSGWRVDVLAKRVFLSENNFRIRSFAEITSEKPSDYKCFMNRCDCTATKTAVFNVWGTVFPIFTCDRCFEEVNGLSGDDLPDLKKPFLFKEGLPVC